MLRLAAIRRRLEQRGYNSTHIIYRRVAAAYTALHALRITANYESCDGGVCKRRDDEGADEFEAGAGI